VPVASVDSADQLASVGSRLVQVGEAGVSLYDVRTGECRLLLQPAGWRSARRRPASPRSSMRSAGTGATMDRRHR